MTEKELRKVVFEFEDGAQKVLEGEELMQWQVICMQHADYLLPGDESMQLVSMYGGLLRGFMPVPAEIP